MVFRIRDVRLARGYSPQQFARMLEVSVASLSQWENGKRFPPLEVIARISDLLEVSIDYLVGRANNPDNPSAAMCEIPASALAVHHNSPLWLTDPKRQLAGWAFVDGVGKRLCLLDGRSINLDDFAGTAHIRAPLLCVGMQCTQKPLTVDCICAFERVWVEPISPDQKLRHELRGWYSVKDRYVANEFQTLFYYWNYGAKWLAFESVDIE